ncbi:MAG TPA: hypothetical protein DEA40_06895, partial [Parvularcula sp.]|nr:hypothetical protein [Parvularcula sp.]
PVRGAPFWAALPECANSVVMVFAPYRPPDAASISAGRALSSIRAPSSRNQVATKVNRRS